MNRKLTDDGWWEAIRNKVEMTEASVPDDLWEELSPAVNASLRRRRICKATIRASLLSAAAALAIVLALPHRSADAPSATATASITPEQISEPDIAASSDSGLNSIALPTRAVSRARFNGISNPVIADDNETDISLMTDGDDTVPSDNTGITTPSEPAGKPERHPSANKTSQTVGQYLATCADESSGSRRKIHISLSGSEESLRQSMSSIVTEWNHVSIMQEDGVELYSFTLMENVRSSDGLYSCNQPEWVEVFRNDRYVSSRRTSATSYRHLPPITAKFAVSVDLDERWSAEAGLAYTLLTSEVVSPGTAFKQRLQFVGIPLSLRFAAMQTAQSSIYVSAGGQVDKCVKADTGFGDIRIDPLFWSAAASIGYQYTLLPHIGLFIEAGGAYHFSNGTREMTIYTEHPLQASMQAGLRFNLRN